LRSLASSGLLESDGKRGATGATCTVAKAADVISGIALARLPIQAESGELGIGKATPIDEGGSGNSCPLPITDVNGFMHRVVDDVATGNGHKRAADACPLEPASPKPKSTAFEGNGRMGDEDVDDTKNGGRLEYEYSEDE